MTVIAFFQFAAYAIIFGAIWRLLEAKTAGTRLGNAMAFIY